MLNGLSKSPKEELKKSTPEPSILDIVIAKTSLMNYISKCEDIETLLKWEHMLDDSLMEVRGT